MAFVDHIRNMLGEEWLPIKYRDRIRSQRTRSVTLDIPSRENVAVIQYTLLGIELKVGRQRFACPDLATARYMRVFARFGCRDFAIPYDITKISAAADDLETSWQQVILRLEEYFGARSMKVSSSARSTLIKSIRTDINEIGSGDPMPLFDRETRRKTAD